MALLPKLNTAASLTLVSLRLWVYAHLRGRPWTRPWSEGLETAGLPREAIGAFDELLTVLSVFPDAFSDVLPLCAHRVSEAEMNVLCLLSGAGEQASPCLCGNGWPATVARIVTQRSRTFAAALAMQVGEIEVAPMHGAGAADGLLPVMEARIH
jgi:hypothetical protein